MIAYSIRATQAFLYIFQCSILHFASIRVQTQNLSAMTNVLDLYSLKSRVMVEDYKCQLNQVGDGA
jgi:hypothetical protein